MIKILSAAAIFLFSFILRADLLEDTERILDILERDYWISQRNTEGDYRKNTEKRLQSLINNVNRIQRTLNMAGKKNIADITTPASTLQRNYGVVKVSSLKRFSFRFKYTAMRNYAKEHKKIFQEKAALQAEEDSENSKGKKNKRRRITAPAPTLANVDLIEYERWLADMTSGNAEKFHNLKNNGSRSEVEKMNVLVSEYFTAINQLRFGLAKIRQKTKLNFK